MRPPMRCKVLQIMGYEVAAMELIDPEETPKNVLIRGIKRRQMGQQQIEKLTREYAEICQMLGIRPYLAEHYHLL